jgi:hypothetical protein
MGGTAIGALGKLQGVSWKLPLIVAAIAVPFLFAFYPGGA